MIKNGLLTFYSVEAIVYISFYNFVFVIGLNTTFKSNP